MKYREISKDLGHICRECLNGKFGLHLTSDDCRYNYYPAVCKVCGEVSHIVEDIKLTKRISIRMKK